MALELDGAVESILKSASVCRALCAVCQNHERWMRICTRRWWSSGLPEHVHDWRRFYIQRCSAEAGAQVQRVKLEKGVAEAAAAEARGEAEYQEEERESMIAWSVGQRAAIERLEALATQHGVDPGLVAAAARIYVPPRNE